MSIRALGETAKCLKVNCKGYLMDTLKEDLKNLKRLRVEVCSISCDGHKAILKVAQKVTNSETGRWWYRHKNLHQARSHLANALTHLFCHLNNNQIPYTTNQL